MNLQNTKFQTKNTSKGITLVSLVITIIVLLILAGVAINMAINSDGLFGKANEAVEGWNTAVADEQTKLNDYLNILESIGEIKYDELPEDFWVLSGGIAYINTKYIDIDSVIDGSYAYYTYYYTSTTQSKAGECDYTKLIVPSTIGGQAVTKFNVENVNNIVALKVEEGITEIPNLLSISDTLEHIDVPDTVVLDRSVTGDYIKYDVTYSDYDKETQFTETNGWRILYRTRNESNPNKWDVKFISTGTIANLSFDPESSTGKENNGWWGDAEDIREVFGSEYSGTGPAVAAAAGLRLNFKSLPLEKLGTSPYWGTQLLDNKCEYRAINGKTTETLYGNEIVVNKYNNLEIKLLTLEELNITRDKSKTSREKITSFTDGAKGLFYLRDLDGRSGLGYWMSSVKGLSAPNDQYLDVVVEFGEIKSSLSGWFRVRPVISIPNVTMTQDANGVWQISQ